MQDYKHMYCWQGCNITKHLPLLYKQRHLRKSQPAVNHQILVLRRTRVRDSGNSLRRTYLFIKGGSQATLANKHLHFMSWKHGHKPCSNLNNLLSQAFTEDSRTVLSIVSENFVAMSLKKADLAGASSSFRWTLLFK